MKYRYHIGAKIDSFKSNWYLFECERESPDGTIVQGSIQADSSKELAADDTFEADE